MKLRCLPLLATFTLLPLAAVRADFSGFNTTNFTLTQGQTSGGLSVASNVATLTNGSGPEGNAIFYNTAQSIGTFTVKFTYQDVGGGLTKTTADGFTFTLQNDSRKAAAVGGTGNSLGYASAGGSTAHNAVSPSVAVCFDIYNQSTTGLGSGGTVNLANTSLAALNSGDPINVTLTYNGTTLTEQLADANVAANLSTFTYAANSAISALGSTAYVGFTGADGGSVSTQTISNFSFSTSVVPEPSTWLAGGLTALTGAAVLRRRCRG